MLWCWLCWHYSEASLFCLISFVGFQGRYPISAIIPHSEFNSFKIVGSLNVVKNSWILRIFKIHKIRILKLWLQLHYVPLTFEICYSISGSSSSTVWNSDITHITTVLTHTWQPSCRHMDDMVDITCANVAIDTVHATMLYGCIALPVNKVKLWNQQHVLFGIFAIKETNFVVISVDHSLQFSEIAAATTNMTDLSRHEYDWRLRLNHINMTDSDLTKYDWRRRLGDGDSVEYFRPFNTFHGVLCGFHVQKTAHRQTDRQTYIHTPMTTRPCELRGAGNYYTLSGTTLTVLLHNPLQI